MATPNSSHAVKLKFVFLLLSEVINCAVSIKNNHYQQRNFYQWRPGDHHSSDSRFHRMVLHPPRPTTTLTNLDIQVSPNLNHHTNTITNFPEYGDVTKREVHENVKAIIVTKRVPIPYPVHVEKKIPYPVKVPVRRPYTVYVPKPYIVESTKPYPLAIKVPVPQPYTVEKRIPIPIRVPVEKPVVLPISKPYPIYIEKKVPIPVEKHIPLKIKVPVERPYPVHIPVEKPVPYPVEKPVPYSIQVDFDDLNHKRPNINEHYVPNEESRYTGYDYNGLQEQAHHNLVDSNGYQDSNNGYQASFQHELVTSTTAPKKLENSAHYWADSIKNDVSSTEKPSSMYQENSGTPFSHNWADNSNGWVPKYEQGYEDNPTTIYESSGYEDPKYNLINSNSHQFNVGAYYSVGSAESTKDDGTQYINDQNDAQAETQNHFPQVHPNFNNFPMMSTVHNNVLTPNNYQFYNYQPENITGHATYFSHSTLNQPDTNTNHYSQLSKTYYTFPQMTQAVQSNVNPSQYQQIYNYNAQNDSDPYFNFYQNEEKPYGENQFSQLYKNYYSYPINQATQTSDVNPTNYQQIYNDYLRNRSKAELIHRENEGQQSLENYYSQLSKTFYNNPADQNVQNGVVSPSNYHYYNIQPQNLTNIEEKPQSVSYQRFEVKYPLSYPVGEDNLRKSNYHEAELNKQYHRPDNVESQQSHVISNQANQNQPIEEMKFLATPHGMYMPFKIGPNERMPWYFYAFQAQQNKENQQVKESKKHSIKQDSQQIENSEEKFKTESQQVPLPSENIQDIVKYEDETETITSTEKQKTLLRPPISLGTTKPTKPIVVQELKPTLTSTTSTTEKSLSQNTESVASSKQSNNPRRYLGKKIRRKTILRRRNQQNRVTTTEEPL